MPRNRKAAEEWKACRGTPTNWENRGGVEGVREAPTKWGTAEEWKEHRGAPTNWENRQGEGVPENRRRIGRAAEEKKGCRE
eukprot:5933356-Pyramimonas_sp.AAC.1